MLMAGSELVREIYSLHDGIGGMAGLAVSGHGDAEASLAPQLM